LNCGIRNLWNREVTGRKKIKFTNHSWGLAVPFVLLIAALLRFYAIGFGLPELLHVDEPFEMHRALRLAAGDFDFTRTGKGGLYFIIFLELAMVFVFLLVGGVVASPEEFAGFFVAHEGSFYLGARAASACIGIASCIVLYKIASGIGGKECGLLGVILLAFSGLHVETSHYATVDGLLVLLLLLSWLYIFRITREDNNRNYIWAGFWGGLAFATKLPGIVILIPLLAAVIIGSVKAGNPLAVVLKKVLVVLGVFIVVSLAVEPGYLNTFCHLGKTIKGLFVVSKTFVDKLPGISAQDRVAGLSPALFYFQQLRFELGTPMFVLAFCSMGWAFFSRSKIALLLAMFFIPYYFAISQAQSHLVFSRYLLPLLPLVFLVAGYGASQLYLFLRDRCLPKNMARLILVCLMIMMIWHPGATSYSFVSRLSNVDTRILTKNWIEKNIESESAIMMEGSPEHQSQFDVQLLNSSKNIHKMVILLNDIAPGKAKYWQLKKKYYATLDRPRFDLRFINWDESYPVLEDIRNQGVQYLILNAGSFDGFNERGTGGDVKSSRIKFIDNLARNKKFVKLYEVKNNGQRFGPHLMVYKVAS